MRPVVIEYRPLLFPFCLRYKRKVPTGWNEVCDKLMVTITRYYNRSVNEDRLLKELFGLNNIIVKRLGRYYKYKLFELFDFITEFNPTKEFVIKDLNGLKAPKTGLKGVSFGRFIYGDSFYMVYLKDGSDDSLNRFIAAFYGGKDFDDDNMDPMIELIKKVPRDKREAIAINYILIKKYLMGKYPRLFVKKEEESPEEKKKPAILRKKSNAGGWVPVFDAMVGDDIVNRDKYAELPVNEALRFLNNQIKNNRRHGN